MLPSLNIKTQFAVITLSLYIIMIIQTGVHKCENVKLENGICPGHFNKCEMRLNCTSRNISSARLQCDKPEKVIRLYLDNNKIDYLGNNVFEGLSNLDTLSLQNNRINNIKNYTFTPLGKMKYLDLRYNLIREIEENSFQNLTSIWRIDLANNQLTRINSGVFTNCDNLYQVFLTENYIEEIKEDSFNERSNVQLFYCSHNRISNLNFLKNLRRLRVLHLSYNNIEEIPINTLLHLRNLRTLDLSHNKLEILNSGTFSELSSLENLSLSDNRLKYLGEGSFDYLHKLDHLDLSNNSLEEFSYYLTFEERNNLTLYIYIDNNKWYCKFIHGIKQLRWIKLRYDHVNKSISNIDGIPCMDKRKYPDRSTSSTKNQPTTLLRQNFNFITVANFSSTTVTTSTNQDLGTTEFLNNSLTTSTINLKTTLPKQTTTTPIVKEIAEERSYRSIISPEVKVNLLPYIVAVAAVVLLIIIVIVSVAVIKRCFRRPREYESEITKDGYMLPDRPLPSRSNFYITLESYNSYEEINELEEHLYAEIDRTSI